MKVGKAVLAGVIGAIAMTILGWLVRQMGIDMNAEMMLGTMLARPESGAWIIGFAMHLMIGVFFALIYAWGFERLTHRAGVVVGLGFAVVHIIFAGVMMAVIPAVHPMIPEMMMPPGAFMSGMGAMGVTLFVLEHLMYGAIVGGMYGAVQHPVPPPVTV
ncbi:MAG: hypothetical protein ACREOK_16315 [Gemmatimonadaceae bacterium]